MIIELIVLYIIGIPLVFYILVRNYSAKKEEETFLIFLLSVMWPGTLIVVLVGVTALKVISLIHKITIKINNNKQ